MKLNEIPRDMYNFYYNLFNGNSTERIKKDRKRAMRSKRHHARRLNRADSEIRVMDQILRERKADALEEN